MSQFIARLEQTELQIVSNCCSCGSDTWQTCFVIGRFATTLGLFLVLGCSGQTGSPRCVATGSCVCDSLKGAVLVRGTLNEINAKVATVTVDEVLAPSENVPHIDVGDEIQGAVRAGLPCSSDERPSVARGADVMVALFPSGPMDGSSGYTGQLWLIPWGAELALGRNISVASTDLHELTYTETCLRHFPSTGTPECNDTVDVSACSATRPNATGNTSFIWLIGAVAVITWIRRRRSRPKV